ncbi:hypothetical protein GEV33_015453 [Tenebrio molitor]|uniref:Uncharacterized protein n=1 Tax=Tenebrio molitor TaxID=7067 RepID=A0A8J6L5M7_TENMO|nr:hypothetical protein GEV33_015453 [Tenebrio molitor]
MASPKVTFAQPLVSGGAPVAPSCLPTHPVNHPRHTNNSQTKSSPCSRDAHADDWFFVLQIDPPSGGNIRNAGNNRLMADDGSSDDANTPLQSPRSQNTSREEDDSSNANESDCKSPSQR